MQTRITAEELSRDLRYGDGPHLKRRRAIIGLCFSSCAALGAVALYQIGILKKLPQPRSKAFDTSKVNGSGEAYSMLATPDAFLGLASYAITATLAGMGSEKRWRTSPWMTVGMTLKLLADSGMAGKLTVDEFRRFKSFSVWSVATALATWTALPLAFPEAKAAVQRLKGHNDARSY